MEEYGNNGIFAANRKQMRAVDGKQEIYLIGVALINFISFQMVSILCIIFILFSSCLTGHEVLRSIWRAFSLSHPWVRQGGATNKNRKSGLEARLPALTLAHEHLARSG